jgi:hypothetical protein
MTQDEMSNFADWLNRAYKRWCKTQPGEEDFLGFCDFIGVEPWKVLEWMRGESEPVVKERQRIEIMLNDVETVS